uniref:Uncharacterized protein n=1 Tax=Klebsiella pneumoniae TaxID=573 RepID=A0A8B0SZ77_KLEPN|nr:hypothetical protein [Klebsiella pneumoniae]
MPHHVVAGTAGEGSQIKFPGVHKTDPLLKPGSKWRHDVPIEPSSDFFVSERPDLYGLAVVQKQTILQKGTNLYVTTPYFSPNGSEQRCSICPRTNCRY